MKTIVVLFLTLTIVGRSQPNEPFPYATMEPCVDRLVEWNSTLQEARSVFDSLKIKYRADKFGFIITCGNVHYRYQFERDALTSISVVITCATRTKAEDLLFVLRQRAYDTWIGSFEEEGTGNRIFHTKCNGEPHLCIVEVKPSTPKNVWITVFPAD